MAKKIEKPAIVKQKHLKYLDELRESGVTNMFGAPAYVQRAFGVSKADSITIWTYWAETFGSRHK